jgi:hyperosmotically inducible periplasmic protein
MKTAALLCLAIVMSLTAGCNTETGQRADASNSELRQKIESRLNTDARLNAAKLTVSADATHNQATISGTVDSEKLQTRAVELAESAAPGVVIDSKISVMHAETTRAEYTEELARQERDKAKASLETVGAALDDAWIHSKVAAKLIEDALVNKQTVHVDVKDNVVILRGTVKTAQEKADAEQIAMKTDGVKSVVNQLKVQP